MHDPSATPHHLEHHFADVEQQRESAKLGMWIFLLTEVLLFGGLFVAYSIYRAWNPDIFHNAHVHLDVTLGALNTVVLIISSVTMALAIRSMQLDLKRATLINLGITLALALVFLIVKYFEYSHKIHLGQLPGKFYSFEGVAGSNPHIFFSIYFLMTGLHGIHILGGMATIGWIMWRTTRDHFSPEYYTPIEMTGLYWHLVDLIWIFLFPLFYLIG
ncbi:MAG: cytochrome c oxidase subunit 3 family protein [candidate division Zixibacteria bacterium]|nr:cytochrome c oxidase subunit 3 family protein [candidate division Zixibacteria bacterium]MDH3935993.1 cytochrome c oxidase subunit 3 family protein [candidate division Zixibacteria bacterium]MDH4032587.1 cytochrome c oxidase subunit 3 family protein [candidate division Zixibacteria bacterium]